MRRRLRRPGAFGHKVLGVVLGVAVGCALPAGAAEPDAWPAVVHFRSADRTLGGELFMPAGEGPFPAVLYNHGSAPGMLSSQASQRIGPLFAAQGWVFFMPYRRGQGLSEQAGRYIGDALADARAHGGLAQAASTMAELLGGEQLRDQLAALEWLRAQRFVVADRVAVAGNSFGGIEALLGAAHADYCAAVDASGGADSWRAAPPLQALMTAAARSATAPVLLFQAANDFDLSPSQVLYTQRQQAGQPVEMKIYPPYGTSAREGHGFAYLGAAVWFPDVLAFLQRHCTAPERPGGR